jgi:DoxX-like family
MNRMLSSTQSSPGIQRAPPATLVAYWLVTLIVVYENLSGFVWWVVDLDYPNVVIGHLGYPPYFLDILGPAQLAAAVILIAPGLLIAKEWAYAGAVINYGSAVASHLLAGDGLNLFVVGVAAYLLLTVASWALRPPSRRLTEASRVGAMQASSWIGPVIVLGLLLVASLLSLPLVAALATMLPL